MAGSAWQDAFPVLTPDGKLAGVVSSDILRTMATDPDLGVFAIADDMMAAPVSVMENDDLHTALEAILQHGVRELLVTSADGRIVGFLDEAEITSVYHATTAVKPESGSEPKTGVERPH